MNEDYKHSDLTELIIHWVMDFKKRFMLTLWRLN